MVKRSSTRCTGELPGLGPLTINLKIDAKTKHKPMCLSSCTSNCGDMHVVFFALTPPFQNPEDEPVLYCYLFINYAKVERSTKESGKCSESQKK